MEQPSCEIAAALAVDTTDNGAIVAPATVRDRRVGAYGALIVGVLCISFSAIFVKLAGVPGPVSALYRFLFTGLVLVPWWLASNKARPTGSRLWFSLACGLFLALDLFLWNTSIMLTSASTATLPAAMWRLSSGSSFSGTVKEAWIGETLLIVTRTVSLALTTLPRSTVNAPSLPEMGEVMVQ